MTTGLVGRWRALGELDLPLPGAGETAKRWQRLAELTRIDVVAGLRRMLPWPAAGRLDELAPERVTVPSGSTVRIDYASATAQSIQYKVNGGSAITLQLPATGSATATATRTVGVTLTSGANTITFTGASAAGVGIDRVSLVR